MNLAAYMDAKHLMKLINAKSVPSMVLRTGEGYKVRPADGGTAVYWMLKRHRSIVGVYAPGVSVEAIVEDLEAMQ